MYTQFKFHLFTNHDVKIEINGKSDTMKIKILINKTIDI